MKRFSNVLFLCLFAAAIALPLLAFLTGWSPVQAAKENRQLAKAPAAKTALRPRRFTPQFDRFYADHFGLRPLLVNVYRSVHEDVFSHSEKAVRGEDGWLFLARGSRPGPVRPLPILPDVCGGLQFSERRLRAWVETLKTNQEQLEKRGIKYLYVLIPNKHSVHGDRLPAHARCGGDKQTRMAQLLTALTETSSVPFVDMRKRLQTLAAQNKQLFYKTDTHWNGNGMLAGYQAVIESIPESIRFIDVSKAQTINPPEGVAQSGDLTRFIKNADPVNDVSYGLKLETPSARIVSYPLPGVFKNSKRQPATWSIQNPALSSALIFHDSFLAVHLPAVFAESFSETTFIWNSAPVINLDWVDKIKPDLVIHEMVERTLLQPYFLDD